MKTTLGYPSRSGERTLLDRREARESQTPTARQILTREGVLDCQRVPEGITVHDDLKDYIVEAVRATRSDPRVEVGVSPRGCQRLFEVVRGYASLSGREFVTPDDVKAVAVPTLAHRLVLTADATIDQTTGEAVVRDIFDDIPVPSVHAKR